MGKFLHILIFSAGILLQGAQFQLLTDGQAQAKIVAPDSVRASVEYFNSEFQKSTGTELNAEGKNIIELQVAQTPHLERSKFTFSFPEPGKMVIEGTGLSLRFALNHLLEAAGIRYPMPGPFGGHYPQIRNLSLPAETRTVDAGFRLFRNLYAEDADWVLALNNIPEDSYSFVNHGVAALFPYDEFRQEKWKDTVWPLIDGQRKEPVQFVWEPCYTSEVTLNAAVEQICSWLEKDPLRRTVALGHNDGSGQFCQCPQCHALDARPNPSVAKLQKHPFRFRKHNSESFCTWANKVAERVLEKYPDTYFGISAYTETLLPPTFRLNDRIMVLFCFESFAQTDAGVRAFWQDLVREWNGKAAFTGWWEYSYGLTAFTLPRAYFAEVDQAVKFMKSQNGEVLFAEGFPSLGDGPKRYLYMRYAWNPDMDLQAELHDWYAVCVGKEAAPFLEEYYNFWDHFWRTRAVETEWFKQSKFATYTALIPDGGYLYALEKGDFAKLRSLMEKVVQKAEESGDANQKTRAAVLLKEFAFYESSAYMHAAEIIPADGIRQKADALALAEEIPQIVRHALKRPLIAQENLEAFPKASWGGSYPYMRKGYQTHFINPAFPDVLLHLNAWLSDAEILRVYESGIQDPAIPEAWRNQMKFMLDVDSGKILNLVPDPSFENGRGSWIALGGISSERAASGKKSFVFTMPRPGRGEMVLRVPMNAQKKYLLMAKIYLDSDYPPGRATASGYILGINSQNVGSNYYIPFKSALVPGKWNPVNTTAEVGKCEDRGDIYIIVEGMEKGEKVYVDDVVFVELTE